MHVLVTCKNEDDLIKNEWTRVVTTFPHYKSMGIFPDAQGQFTPQTLVKSAPISNLFKMLLPARIEKIRSKLKALEWTQDFPHYQAAHCTLVQNIYFLLKNIGN